MVLISYIWYRLAEKAGLTQWIRNKCSELKRLTRWTHQVEVNVEGGVDANPFPDRLINPGEYKPNAQEHTTSVSDPIQSTGDTKKCTGTSLIAWFWYC